MHSDVAISVSHLTKTYRIFEHPADRIKQALTFGRVPFHSQFTALKDVSFEIRKGETVGIIGRNGSGKSTLLQLICGILKPTSGAIGVTGRISALLELGSGFNPEFTGRENVFFQGAVMGFPKEDMARRFDDIAAFAEIGQFMEQPVRTYSSGMYVRLAFSVAIHVLPEILVVDEALSVGDVVFQHKSRRRVQELVDGGSTLLLVSHDRSMITSACKRCIMLDKGQVKMDGYPSDVFDYYHAFIAAKGNEQIQQHRLESGRAQIASGTGEASVERVRLIDRDNTEIDTLEVGAPITLEFQVRIFQPIPLLVLSFVIRDRLGQIIFNTNTNSFNQSPKGVARDSSLIFRFYMHANMGPGSYSISCFLTSTNDRFSNNYETRELACFFDVLNQVQPLFYGSAWLSPTLDIQYACES